MYPNNNSNNNVNNQPYWGVPQQQPPQWYPPNVQYIPQHPSYLSHPSFQQPPNRNSFDPRARSMSSPAFPSQNPAYLYDPRMNVPIYPAPMYPYRVQSVPPQQPPPMYSPTSPIPPPQFASVQSMPNIPTYPKVVAPTAPPSTIASNSSPNANGDNNGSLKKSAPMSPMWTGILKAQNKVIELGATAGSITYTKLDKFAQLTLRKKKEKNEIVPPKNGFEKIRHYDPLLYRVQLSKLQCEQLFFVFRNITKGDGKFDKQKLKCLFSPIVDINQSQQRVNPHVDFIVDIVAVLLSLGDGQSSQIVEESKEVAKTEKKKEEESELRRKSDEKQFTEAYHRFVCSLDVICKGNVAQKLWLFFRLFCKEDFMVAEKLLQNLTHLLTSLSNIQTSPPSINTGRPAALINSLFEITNENSMYPRPLSTCRLKFSEFVDAVAKQGTAFANELMDMFGLIGIVHSIFLKDLELKDKLWKEGFLQKSWSAETFSIKMYQKWQAHWCCVANGFFWYYDQDKYESAERVVNLSHVSVAKDVEIPNTFVLTAGSQQAYQRKFTAETEEECEEWIAAIASHCTKAEFNYQSSFCERKNTKAKWYVDGKDTFQDIARAIEGAKEQVFLTDWYLSPEVYLVREHTPKPKLNEDYRLDKLLQRKTKEGVEIYVLIWNETKAAMSLNSKRALDRLQLLHKNIRVMTHPLVAPLKWSHHQKTVVVDQQIAFVGGLDLCFGRYDDQLHLLIDVCDTHLWPGKDYYNPLFCGIQDVHKPMEDAIDRSVCPRMGWHDIHMCVEGLAARDVGFNFIQRWNSHKEVTNSLHPYILPKSIISSPMGAYTCQVLRIASTLLDKIRKAIQHKMKFRVIVVMPAYPDGQFKDKASVRYLMNWNYNTISRGGTSIMETLTKEFPGINVLEYISFNSLRNYGFLNGKSTTEQIYVHSKLMIVDDRVVIIGSANINDRSMLGNRDSEIAIITSGTNDVLSYMNGVPYHVNSFAHSLRVALWKEHLGLPPESRNVEDPIRDSVYYDLWVERSARNTEIYRQVFPIVPHDGISHLSKMNSTGPSSSDSVVVTKLTGIRGHLINFPLDFLKHEDLKPSLTLNNVDVLMADCTIFT